MERLIDNRSIETPFYVLPFVLNSLPRASHADADAVQQQSMQQLPAALINY
jgi:hypothetical protein